MITSSSAEQSPTEGSPAAEQRRAPARRGQGAALKADILAAATALIAHSGDATSLTLRAVAREVGVAATSIYLHFGSVEELLLAVKICRFQELTDSMSAAVEKAGADPLARVLTRAHAYVTYGAEHPGEYVVMFASRLTPTGGPPSRTPIAETLFTELVTDLCAVRRRDRPMMDRTEATMVAFHLWTSLHGMVSLRLLRPLMPWPPVDTEIDDLVTRLLDPAVH